MGREGPTVRTRARGATVLEACLARREVGIAYRPIHDLVGATVFARTALVRSTTPAFPTTTDLVRRATEEGRLPELGRLVRRLAVRGAGAARVVVPVSAAELSVRHVLPDDPIFSHAPGVAILLSPRNAEGQLAVSPAFLESLRLRGIALALDGWGGRSSVVADALDLAPRIVRLAPELLDVEANPRGARYLGAIVQLALDVGALVIATELDTPARLEAARTAGIRYGEGEAVARPTPIESIDLGN